MLEYSPAVSCTFYCTVLATMHMYKSAIRLLKSEAIVKKPLMYNGVLWISNNTLCFHYKLKL